MTIRALVDDDSVQLVKPVQAQALVQTVQSLLRVS